MSLLPCLACLLSAQAAYAHGGTSNELEREVCSDASLGDYCEFTDHHERVHRGTCRSFDEVLMCVRNQPFDSEASAAAPDSALPSGSESAHEEDASISTTTTLAIALGLGTVAVGFFALRKQGISK